MPETGRFLSGRRLMRIAVVLAALIAATAAAWFLTTRETLPDGVSQVEYDSARKKFRALYRRRPNRTETLSLAGEMAVGDGRLATAAACFAAIPGDDRRHGPSARLQAGQVLLRLDRVREAEQN